MQLSVSNLTKVYQNGVRAMQSIHLEIQPGMFGLLGPNGAGKSTFMRTLATLQAPDSGHIQFGTIDVLKNPMELRHKLGYLPQDFGVYPKESAERLLHYFARLKGLHQGKERQAMVDYVLELTNLSSVRKEAVSSYSGGMKQRFGIAQLLLNRPQLIIVDEPTAGLDPAERNRFLNLLREIGHTATVIFSTHIVEDVKELCQEMAILYRGQVLQHTAPKEATADLEGKIWRTTVSKQELPKLESQYQVLSSSFAPDQNLWVRVYSDQLPGTDFQQVSPDLEDVYFYTLKNA